MTLNDAEMGQLVLLIPAEPFGLDVQETVEQATVSDVTNNETTPEKTTEESQFDSESDAAQVEKVTTEAKPFDVEKQKKRVDACLKESHARMGEELGAMLGTEVKLSEHTTRLMNKEDYFFDEASGKQILAHIDVVGDIAGKGYLYISLKDAIFIGGTLIMLPPGELVKSAAEEDFNDDIEDAYGEIANIISGVYTKVFEEQYPDKIRFIKTGLEQVVPMKVDTESDAPMPDVSYYMATSKVTIGDKSLGNLQLLVPASIFQLERLGEETAADDAQAAEKTQSTVSSKADAATGFGSAGVKVTGEGVLNPEFIILSNDGGVCSTITAVLNNQGIAYKVLDYKESVSDYLPGDVKAVFLVMSTVDEQGLGVAVKISAASSLPLIAVGPEWTRTKVIKAVKYGVDDILLTPASEADIMGKINSVQAKMAA